MKYTKRVYFFYNLITFGLLPIFLKIRIHNLLEMSLVCAALSLFFPLSATVASSSVLPLFLDTAYYSIQEELKKPLFRLYGLLPNWR